MKQIDELTLICVDTINQQLALNALHKTLLQIKPSRCYFFTDLNEFDNKNNQIELVYIEPLNGIDDYNQFILKKLNDYVKTSHVLVIQFDGFVVNGASWSNDFLEFDYIGAVWPFRNENECVGNGGFSLRSKRLLEALQDADILTNYPEDDIICLRYRQLLETKYGIKIAPKDSANKFSVEKDRSIEFPFGFHGIFNFHLFFNDHEIYDFIFSSSLYIFKKLEFIELIHNLFTQKRIKAANKCLEKCFQNDDFPTILLEMILWHISKHDNCPCGSGLPFEACHLSRKILKCIQ
jgi:hypothetical protein